MHMVLNFTQATSRIKKPVVDIQSCEKSFPLTLCSPVKN